VVPCDKAGFWAHVNIVSYDVVSCRTTSGFNDRRSVAEMQGVQAVQHGMIQASVKLFNDGLVIHFKLKILKV